MEPADHINGVAVAIVRDNKDSAGSGRVRVSFPWHDRPDETYWARIAMPAFAAAVRFIPDVNDEVLVAFERGDLRFPYVIGLLWNGTDRPPETRVTLDSRQMEIDDGKGNAVTIDSASGRMTIRATGSLTIKAPQISIEAGGTLAMKAGGTLTIQGSIVSIN